MNLLQRAKAPLPFLRKARATRLFLTFASLLLCLTVLSVFATTGTAYAASTSSRSATTVTPATSGGGCLNDVYNVIRACISENSQLVVVPDVYILKTACSVFIALYEDNSSKPLTYDSLGTKCFAAGTHLYGFSADAYTGHRWYTYSEYQYAVGVRSGANSPSLYT